MMSSRTLVICAVCYAAVLSLSIGGASLWTDEAFSAWLASHESLRSLAGSLLTGGSSDLQMALYYVYLFFWTKLFGAGEFALRAANIPFILLFSFVLVWSSARLFKSRAAWLAAGMLPFVWHYASEARPYMILLALSTTAFACVVRFITADFVERLAPLPWICLASLIVGSLFHMLFLLAAAPMALILGLAYWSDRSDLRWRYWTMPLAVFVLPFGALAGFFAFTLHRGIVDYNYPPPGVRQMASVAYELAGFSGFGPNRKFSLDFHPYAVPVVLGALAICAGMVFAAYPVLLKLRLRDRVVPLLGAAALLGVVEVLAVAFATRKQPDARHLAALVPIFLFLFMGLIRRAGPRTAAASLILLGGAWFISDLRAEFLPEYQKEDYRDAVSAALSIHQRTGADIAVAADPVAAAYYGLDVRGPAPCYPIQGACGPAFQRVPWPRRAPAIDAAHWSQAEIQNWLAVHRERGIPAVVVMQLDRAHLRDSDWGPVLAGSHADHRLWLHGFEVVMLQNRSTPEASLRFSSRLPGHTGTSTAP
ncbi:MAG: hypothetical protein LAP40_13745 [Acidobacteriia bacterium]|nr:hypothetical protein [Terriglobia bacterium]